NALTLKKQTLDGTFFDFEELKDLEINLLGSYQIENATNVLNAVNVLKSQGIEITETSIKNGLKKAKWNARFEIISHTPLIIFDGGHNPQGVCEAVKSVKQYFGNQKLNIVTGVMADKDYNFIATKISEVASKVFCLTPDNPRALNAKDYATVFNNLGIDASYYNTVQEAVTNAINDAIKNSRSVLCLGSLYMYNEVVNSIT
ncbi:MAG: bifunctional folylpolyglutamate synthase/dihydrofolate synthase, partial [Clostridia bacterium]|nr:bifunctional folylpolyglutamate synthase/dihydrofolate synthase [Clostridia bacterium]